MKILFNVDNKELGSEVKKLVDERLKHLVRDQINVRIKKMIDTEVEKRLKNITDEYVKRVFENEIISRARFMVSGSLYANKSDFMQEFIKTIKTEAKKYIKNHKEDVILSMRRAVLEVTRDTFKEESENE